MSVNKQFAEAAKSLYGCDGGNLNSSLWICGLEWGGADKHNLEEVKSIDHSIGWDLNGESIEDCLRSQGMGYNQKIAWLFSYLFNWDINRYYLEAEKHHLMCHQGTGFKMNMLPLAFNNRNNIEWTKEHKEFTNLTSFEEYKEWAIKHRGAFFQGLVAKHNSKLIVCTGTTSATEFMEFFGCNNFKEGRFHNDTMRLYVGKTNNNKTTVIVSPFFGGPSGINSYAKMEALSDFIKQYHNISKEHSLTF